MTNLKKQSSLFPCFFCNVDSTELKFFVFGTIGALATATLCLGIGLWLRGSFRNTEKMNDYVLKVESEDGDV